METDNARAPDSIDALFDRRAARAANAIIALENTYASEPVIFFKTLDNILIALGEPLGLRVTVQGVERTFSTLLDPNPSAGRQLSLFGAGLSFQVLKCGGGEPAEILGALERASDFLARVDRHVTEIDPAAAGRVAVALRGGFEHAASASRQADEGEGIAPNGVVEEQARDQLGELFERLEPFFAGGNYKLDLPGPGHSPRFLFFHHYVGPEGRPAIRLHLLKSQKDRLRAWLGAKELSAFELSAGRVFEFGRWTVQDSFRTGVSRWAAWPWHHETADEETAVARRAITALGLGRTSDGISPGDDAASALLIPIHVDGLPWLAIAGIVRRNDAGGQLWAQDFYRDLLPYLTTTIRSAAERAYLSEIRGIARESISGGRTELASVTEALAPLTATFPYKKIVLSEAHGPMEEAFQWRGASVFLESEPISVDTTRVEYNRLSRQGVVAALRDGERDARVAQERRLEARLLSYINIGHTLKNIVTCTGWPAAAREVGIVNKYFEGMKASGFPPKDINKLRMALGYADRSLSLFWMVEGLGHFIRLAGAQAGNFEWNKFSDWIPLSAAQVPTGAAFQKAYADSVYALAVSLCYGRGWLRASIISGDGKTRRQWSGEAPSPLHMNRLHFPPFKPGSDAGYVFAICMLEPIVNAIRGLEGLPEGLSRDESDPSLDIVVWTDPGSNDVCIEIANLSTKDLPETLSGFESTKTMAREVGVATFDRPSSNLISPGLYRVTSTMRFTPNAVVEAIRNASQAKGSAR